jgi:hypothetical protein
LKKVGADILQMAVVIALLVVVAIALLMAMVTKETCEAP